MAINEPDPQRQLCCSKSSREFVKFTVQVSVGASVILFCMIMLGLERTDDQYRAMYLSILTFTVGFFLPHPIIEEPPDHRQTMGSPGSSPPSLE